MPREYQRSSLERAAENKLKVIVMTAKPGMVIGRSGTGIDELKERAGKDDGKELVIIDIRRSEKIGAGRSADSRISIAQALERRVSFRRAMKQAIGRTMKAGAKGIKVLSIGKTRRCGNRQIRKVQRR